MQADPLVPWLTTGDLAAAFSIRDRRLSASLARRLGGVKIGGRWRVPPDAVDRLRIIARAQADHPVAPVLPSSRVAGPDPSVKVPAVLAPGWAD